MHISGHESIGLSTVSNHGAEESRRIAQHSPDSGRPHTEATASGSDRVELSAPARDVQRVTQLAQQAPEVRDHLVTAATRALQEGALSLQGSDLAGPLISAHLHTTEPTK